MHRAVLAKFKRNKKLLFYEGNIKIFFIIIILCLLTVKLPAQTISDKQIEMDLNNTYSTLLSCRFGNNTDWDSISAINDVFREKLLKYTSVYPSTLTYNFDSLLNNNIMIVSSEDKLFRIYSWNSWLGGTMQSFENVFQYKAGEKVFSTLSCDTTTDEESDYVPFYTQIFTLNSNGKTYYLAVNNGIYSTNESSQSIKIFAIEDNSLIDTVRLIKTKSGLVNSINVNFNLSSVVNRTDRPLRLIKFDAVNKIIRIPVVKEDGNVSNRFILYKFNGHYFEHLPVSKKIKKR